MRSLKLSLAPAPPGGRGRPRAWLAAGVALGIVALARPQWGRVEQPVFDQSREIVLALDLSRSMLTADVSPSRLERAKLLVASLLDHLEGERVGLVSFAGTAFLQSPLSADCEVLREFLPSLGPDFLPDDGTDYGAMIDTAAQSFTSDGPSDRFLIVLSDGGATDEDWRSHIPKLADKGIRVIGLGIGTAEGGLIPDGSGGFLKDGSGAVVMSRLEGANLRELCDRTGGAYRAAGNWVDLAGLLRATVEAGRKGRFVDRSTLRYVERFQWLLAPALVCLLVSFWRELPARPKPRIVQLGEGGARPAAGAATALALLIAALHPAPARAGATAAETPSPGVLLGRIVGRLSVQDTASALDCVEFGRQTVTWGRDLRTGGKPVPAGPVQDALEAADKGEAMNPKATDWGKLRAELKALLQPPDEQRKPPPVQQKQQQQQEQRSRQESKQEQDRQPQNQEGQARSESPPKSQQTAAFRGAPAGAAAAPAAARGHPAGRRDARTSPRGPGGGRSGPGRPAAETRPDSQPGLARPAFPDARKQRTAPAHRKERQAVVIFPRAFPAVALLSLGLLGLPPARAQSIRWDPPAGTLAVGQTTALQLVCENCEPKDAPVPPKVDGLTLSFAGQSSKMAFENGVYSHSVIYGYAALLARRQAIEIPSFTIETDKGAMRVPAARFEPGGATVGSGGQALESAANSRLEAEPSSVWAGEVFGLAYSIQAGRDYYPDFGHGMFDWNPDPLVVEDWSQPEPFEARAGSELQTGLVRHSRAVASKPGRFQLNPANHLVNLSVGVSGFGFFQQRQYQQFSVTSAAPTIDVRPLPPAPDGFKGAVGQFKLISKVVPVRAAIGDPVTWTLELGGTGNWPEISCPAGAAAVEGFPGDPAPGQADPLPGAALRRQAHRGRRPGPDPRGHLRAAGRLVRLLQPADRRLRDHDGRCRDRDRDGPGRRGFRRRPAGSGGRRRARGAGRAFGSPAALRDPARSPARFGNRRRSRGRGRSRRPAGRPICRPSRVLARARAAAGATDRSPSAPAGGPGPDRRHHRPDPQRSRFAAGRTPRPAPRLAARLGRGVGNSPRRAPGRRDLRPRMDRPLGRGRPRSLRPAGAAARGLGRSRKRRTGRKNPSRHFPRGSCSCRATSPRSSSCSPRSALPPSARAPTRPPITGEERSPRRNGDGAMRQPGSRRRGPRGTTSRSRWRSRTAGRRLRRRPPPPSSRTPAARRWAGS